MNRLKFQSLIDNPFHVSEDTISELADIVKEYPYFQAARMLWVKNLHETDNIRFNGELKQAAAFISNRAKLHTLITSYTAVEEENKVEVSEVEVESLHNLSSDIILANDVCEQEIGIQTSQEVETQNYFEVSDSFDLGGGEAVDFSTFSKENQEEEVLDQNEMVLPSADFLDYEFYSSSSAYVVEKEIGEEVRTDESRSFSEWLKVMRHAPMKDDEEPVLPKKKSRQLIDNFLNEKPKIIPKKVDSSHDGNEKSADSNLESDDLMTETLANIHIKQKHYLKAVNIFEKLRLKYPEKNVYFANRIKELEDLINNV